MEQQTSELAQFKNHIALYELLLDRAQKRSTESIMPKINELREVLHTEIVKSEERIKQIEQSIGETNEKQGSQIVSSAFTDPIFLTGMFVLILVIFYLYRRYGKALFLV